MHRSATTATTTTARVELQVLQRICANVPRYYEWECVPHGHAQTALPAPFPPGTKHCFGQFVYMAGRTVAAVDKSLASEKPCGSANYLGQENAMGVGQGDSSLDYQQAIWQQWKWFISAIFPRPILLLEKHKVIFYCDMMQSS